MSAFKCALARSVALVSHDNLAIHLFMAHLSESNSLLMQDLATCEEIAMHGVAFAGRINVRLLVVRRNYI